MLRQAFLVVVTGGGARLLKALELLAAAEALLVAGVIASVLLFFLPESGRARDPESLMYRLGIVIGVYAIVLKFSPWMAVKAGGTLAVGATVILLLAFAGLVLFGRRRSNIPASNTQ